MIRDSYIRKKINRTIINIVLILFVIFVIFLMYKYSVEGEKDMPFNISKMVVISSAQTDNLILQDNNYTADIIQKNDIYLYFDKNQNYSKDEMIKSISISDFNINKKSEIGSIKIYRTSMLEDKTFEYNEKYEAENIVYMGGLSDNNKTETQIISNQGGGVYFSIANVDLGKVTYLDNENIESTGKLLNRLNISNEQIKFNISFDVILELESGSKFKTRITLELPEGNILQNGVEKIENININDFIFKRVS